MEHTELTLDGLILICLCADLFELKAAKPLSKKQYQRLEEKLRHSLLKRPIGLLSCDSQEMKIQLALNDDEVQQIQERLALLTQTISTIAYYQTKGIEVVTKYESIYPTSLVNNLKKEAPLILFYSGDFSLLQEKAISIAGPVHQTEQMSRNTLCVVDKIYHENYHLMTSAHAGCEELGMFHLLNKGGKVILFTSDHLLKKSIEMKRNIQNKQMLMISHRPPESDYDIIESVIRNSYMYALCETNFIIHSELNTGALYFSAIQNLKYRWSKILAIVDDEFYGNAKLVEAGAIPVTMERVTSETTIEQLTNVNKEELKGLVKPSQLSIYEFMEEA